MASITWKGGTDDFNAASRWSNGTVPRVADIAVVDTGSGASSITLDGAESVAGLTLNDPAGSLTLSGALSLNGGVLNLQAGSLTVSGTVSDGTLTPDGGVLTVSGPSAALLGVTVEGTLDLGNSGAAVDVRGLAQSGLTQLDLGANTQIYFLDPEIFDGQTIEMAGGVLATDGLDPNDGSLFFGPDTTVIQNAASTTARIGPDTATSLFGLGQVTNEGTLIAAAGTLDLDSEGGAFDSVLHQGPFTNVGTIEIDAGATVIDDTNSTLPGLGTILNSGGLLDLKGTLTNTGATIDIAASRPFSNLQLDDTVIGGTIEEDGGTLAIGTASLQGVTLEGTGVAFDTLTIGRGTEFDPSGAPFTLTALAAAYGQIYLNNGAVLANASIAYGGTQYQANLIVQGGTNPADRANPAATLAASTTLDVGSGQILRLDAGQNGTLVNDAVINVAAGGRLEFGNAASYVAGGTINVAPGAIVELDGGTDLSSGLIEAGLTGIGLAGLTNVVGSGATLVNLGSLNLDGQTLSAAGDANFSTFVNEGEVANGTYVMAPGQNPNLGQIDPGTTLVTGPGVFPVDSVTMAGGGLHGAVQMDADGTFDVTANLNLANANGTGPGTLILDQQPTLFVLGVGTSVQFLQSVTVSNAVVLLSGVTTANEASAFSGASSDLVVEGYYTLTLAPSTEIIETTVNGPLGVLGGPGFAVNQGTIAVTPGADFLLGLYGSATEQNFINNGLITIAAGGTLDAALQDSIQSLGSIVGPGGLLRLDTPDAGTNTYVNTGTMYVGGPTGAPNLELASTGITGGTIVNAGGQFTALEGNLTGVTYIGPLDLTSGVNLYGVAGNGYLYFNGGTLDSQSVTLSAGSELILGMSQDFVGATLSLGGELADTGNALGFDANTTVDITGSVYMPVGHLLNAGTIDIGPGASLQLADAGSASGPETSEPGTIFINDGSFSAGVLNAGQTVILGPDSTFSASRFDPGSDVVFQAPNTLTINQGTTFGASAAVSDFGVGDTIVLGGYEDGILAPYIYHDASPHYTDPAITFAYDGETLDVIQSGATTIAAIPIGPGYDVNGFAVSEGPDAPYIVNSYAITYAPPGAPPPSLPVISGTQADQPTTDLAAIDPFSNVSITDVNSGAVDTAIVTLIGTVDVSGINYIGTYPTGTLSNPGIGTLIDGGAGYMVTGSPDAVQAALRGLVFTPLAHQTAPGLPVTTSFTIALNDQFASVTDSTTSVAATAADDPLLVSGVASPVYVNNNVNAAQPFHHIALSDPDNATFTATATLASSDYLSFGKSYGATISTNGIWSTSGSLAFVETALQGLVAYVNSVPPGPSGTTATTTMSMSINDGAADTVTAVSTIDIVSGGSIVAGGIEILGASPGQTTSDQTPIDPFSVVAVEDANVGVVDTVTVTMSNAANGTFSDAVGGTVNGGTFTVTGTPDPTQFGLIANIDSALAGLVFTPTRGQVPSGQSVTTWFPIVANDGSHSATDASTSVIATDEGGQLAINGTQANQELTDGTIVQPLAGVTITDTQPTPVDTATVTLSNPASGGLTAGNGGTVGTDGVFQLTGPLAEVQTALQAIGFTPATLVTGQMATSGMTISVTDGTLNATDATTSLDVIGTGAGSIVAAVNPAVAGLSSSGPALAAGTSADSFVLNLGTVQVGAVVAPIVLDALNTATGPADALDGSFAINDLGGFLNSGFVGFTTLAAGTSIAAGTITLDTSQPGSFSEAITLTPTDVGAGGFSAALPTETLTITGTVAAAPAGGGAPAPAIAGVASAGTIALSAGTIDFGAVHLDGSAQQMLAISNTASAGTASLDGSVSATTGDATASGSFSGLAPGAPASSAISVGINTGTVGVKDGTATLAFVSDAGTLGLADLLSQDITVTGSVYREAAATLLPLNEIVHVGDPGTASLAVSNSDPADGYSESLIAALIGTSGGISIDSAGPTGDILAGATNASALGVGFSTAQAGTISGAGTIALTSDGGIGPDSIDNLGTTALGDQTVAVNVAVDNYAAAELTSNGNLTSNGSNAFTLNLGSTTEGTAALSANLGVLNDVAGPADWLSGTLAVSGSGQFNNAGFGAFGTIGAGGSVAAGGVTLATNQLGMFSEMIVLTPMDSNADGFSEMLAAQTVTVVGTITPIGTANGDVHMVTYDGLHYDFQADGDFVLTRSTAPGNDFQIQIATAPDAANNAVSYTTEAAAQVGADCVTFAIARASTVWVDGTPDTALSAADPVQTLDGGQLRELSSNSFQLTWASGEVLTITDQGSHLDSSVLLGAANGPGSVQGLLGGDSGQASDFQLPDGSIIAQPLSGSELYGAFADAWSVTPTDSLLDAPATIGGSDPPGAPLAIGATQARTMQFIYADAGGQTVLQADAPGQVLSATAGADVLSDAGGFGVIFQGTLADFANALISGASTKDLIDITDLDSATVTTSHAGSASAGVLYLTDGAQNGELYLAGQLAGGSFHVASDGHGGTQIAFG